MSANIMKCWKRRGKMSTTFFNNCYFERRWICISMGKGGETNKEDFQKKKIMLSKNSIIKLLIYDL